MCVFLLLLFRANMESETRVENKRIVRHMQQESVEHAMEEKLQMAEREREYREKQKRQEEQLTKVHTCVRTCIAYHNMWANIDHTGWMT